MTENTLITEIGEWLVDEALAKPDIIKMFDTVCQKLYGAGIPLARARLSWPTLHPLFKAETVLWRRGQEPELDRLMHQTHMPEGYSASPMAFMIEHDVPVIRRNLDGPNKLIDFPILDDLIEEGYTDYLTIRTPFNNSNDLNNLSGIIVAWSADRPGGFSDDDIAALQKIQRRVAVACRSAIQNRIAGNIVETYLGKQAGRQVLDGAIKRGDGQETQAVVWYSDMRDATALGDTMPAQDYFDLLNDYYECTAGPAIKHGGEVLDFIGDAVLAIFPYPTEDTFLEATEAATRALHEADQRRDELNVKRAEQKLVPIRFGVGLNTGRVMFGNIGVRERLTFSVIGPTVNEVARIESLTRTAGTTALVTEKITSGNPKAWKSTGKHKLVGVSKKMELFSPIALEAQSSSSAAEPRVLN